MVMRMMMLMFVAAAAAAADGCDDVGNDHIFTHRDETHSQTVTKVTPESGICSATKN